MSNENLEEMKEAAENAAESIKEKAEDIKEAAAEKTEDIKEAVAEKAEDAKEAVAEKAEDIKEAVAEKAEDVKEAVAEKAEDVKEAAAEKVQAVKAKAAGVVPKAAPKAAPVIKKKSGVNMTTLIVIIVCAVIVLACAAFVLYKTNTFAKWFQKDSYTLDPHDTIEISESDVEITDDAIENYVTMFQEAYETTEEKTSGTVADGDVVHITYVGKIDGEEFEGGTSSDDGTDLTIGSGTFIDGFEDGLIGKKIGSTVDLDLTFPEDYSDEDVAGKDVTFTVDIEYVEVTNTPEFTDDFVKENSAEYTETKFSESTQIDTAEDYRTYIHDYLYDLYLEDSLEDALAALIHVKSYDYSNYQMMMEYEEESLDYYASYYGTDADTLASYYGYDDAAAYNKSETEYQLSTAMLYSALASELGITHTDAEIDEELQTYMDDNGYSETYTVDEFKELNGEAFMYMYKNYQVNYEPVIEAMKERVVIVPAEEEETTAADDAAAADDTEADDAEDAEETTTAE